MDADAVLAHVGGGGHVHGCHVHGGHGVPRGRRDLARPLPGERRVALVPALVPGLVKLGHEVRIDVLGPTGLVAGEPQHDTHVASLVRSAATTTSAVPTARAAATTATAAFMPTVWSMT